MSHWNYRIVNLTQNPEDPWFEVQEVFYNDDGSIAGFADAYPGDEHPERVIEVLQRMIDDIKRNPTIVTEKDCVGFATPDDLPF